MYQPSRAIFVIAIVALILGACAPAAQQTQAPQAQNTAAGIVDVQSQIGTSVALTIEAQNQIGTLVAQTMEAQATPTAAPSATLIPTITPFTLATATNTPWASGGIGGGSGGGGGGSTGPSNNGPYDCSVVRQKPYDGDRIWAPGSSFDVVWTIKNVGTKKIPADAYFTYIGGEAMSPTGGFMIGSEVPVGEKIDLRVEVTAPNVSGTEKEQFTMQWALIVAGVKICRPYIAIFVQK